MENLDRATILYIAKFLESRISNTGDKEVLRLRTAYRLISLEVASLSRLIPPVPKVSD